MRYVYEGMMTARRCGDCGSCGVPPYSPHLWGDATTSASSSRLRERAHRMEAPVHHGPSSTCSLVLGSSKREEWPCSWWPILPKMNEMVF